MAVGTDEELLEIYHTENPSNTIDLNGLTIMPVLPSFLLPTLVVIPIVVLLVLIVLRKYRH